MQFPRTDHKYAISKNRPQICNFQEVATNMQFPRSGHKYAISKKIDHKYAISKKIDHKYAISKKIDHKYAISKNTLLKRGVVGGRRLSPLQRVSPAVNNVNKKNG
jgi:hypothetical protein